MSSLYTLIFYVCMVASPDGGRTPPPCKDVHITVSMEQIVGDVFDPQVAPLNKGAESDKKNKGGISPYLCQHIGMVEGQRYHEEHPLWAVRKWSCPPPGEQEQDI